VLEGALEHKDSMGNGSIIRPGDVQRMSAGTGVTHSEFNSSRENPVHFLQIWILPDRSRHAPGYDQKAFSTAERAGQRRLLASPDGAQGSIQLHQDVKLYASLLAPGQKVEHALKPKRHAYLHVARGSTKLAGVELFAGDAVKISDAQTLAAEATSD